MDAASERTGVEERGKGSKPLLKKGLGPYFHNYLPVAVGYFVTVNATFW